MVSGKMIGLAATALRSNIGQLEHPYKLTFSITYRCQSRCLTCVKPDEIIIGDNAPISALHIGGHAVGSTGLNKVSQTFSRIYSGNMTKIKASGLLPLEVTPEHPVLVMSSKTLRHCKTINGKKNYFRTYNFGNPEWKEAKDISPKTSFSDGDYLCTPIIERTLTVTKMDLKHFNKGRGIAISKAKGVPLEFPINTDTAWLLGIYAAEGCPASNGARFSFNVTEIDLHARLTQIAEGLGYSVSKTENRGCASCCLSSHVLSRAFAEWCGTGAPNKKIPDFILFNKDASILKAFLKGWEDGDGYWARNNLFVGSSVSKTLALQLQLAYASLGISARVTFVKGGQSMFYDKPINKHDFYVIQYLKDPKYRYSRRIGNYFIHPIREIEHVPYSGAVHNIETADNTYLVSNAVVHNCNIWEMKPVNELTLDEIKDFASKNTYFKWIEITGGEPFLRSDIVEIVKAFKENCKDLYILTMPTNSLCNNEVVLRKIEEMLNMGIPKISITVSLDGYREMHDKIRGIPGNFDRCMAMFKGLRELQKRHRNLFMIFGYTMSKFNQGQFEKTYEGVKAEIPDITYNDFHLNIGQISDIYYSNTDLDFKASREQAAAEISEMIKKRKLQVGAIPAIEGVFLKKLVDYVNTNQTPIKSRSLDASLFMDSYGNVFPSIMWGRKIGNIRESNYSLAPIWHSKDAEEVRALIKEGKEPSAWTACEAYQAIVGNVLNFIR